MKKPERIVSASLLALLAAVFAYWALARDGGLWGLLMAALYCLLFGILVLRFIGAFFSFCADDYELPTPDDLLGPRSLRFSRRHPWWQIAVCTLLLHLALYFIAYILDTAINGYSSGMWDTLRSLWLRTDSPSYLGIAENWYVTEGDPRFHIVFFPLYPVFIKAVQLISGDYFIAAMIVSNLFSILAAIACYELSALDLPRQDALHAVKYMLILPAAFFLCAPMTESLFLFLTLMALYFMRKKRFFWACLLAALASLTRLPGVLVLIPIGIEMIGELCILYRARHGGFVKTLCRFAGCLLLGLCGILAYLLINYTVTGEAFTFMTYQREHWHQQLSWFFNTAAYQTEYMLSAESRLRWGLYLPNLAACVGALLLMRRKGRKMRSSYQAYFLVYFAVTVGATWLLSAPRYFTVAYPLILACAYIGENRGADKLLTLGCVALMLGYMGMYVLGYPVY